MTEVELWDLSRLKPYEKNPRVISDEAVRKVAESIRQFGFRQPIVVDEAGVIVVGHTRRLAALRLKLAQVPVHVAKGLSDDELRAYRLADNRTGEEAKWDVALLGPELAGLAPLGFTFERMGFDVAGLGELGLDVDGTPAERSDPRAEWQGMPEFEQPDKLGWRTLYVHFKNQQGLDAFAQLVGQKITDRTKYIWYPENDTETNANGRRYEQRSKSDE